MSWSKSAGQIEENHSLLKKNDDQSLVQNQEKLNLIICQLKRTKLKRRLSE